MKKSIVLIALSLAIILAICGCGEKKAETPAPTGTEIVPASDTPTPTPTTPAINLPPELATLFNVGKWPLAAGTYDPALDGIGIPDGASIFGLFDSAYAPLPAPTSIASYKTVRSVAKVVKGYYYVLNAASGYGYVVIGIDVTTPSKDAPTLPPPPSPSPTTPADNGLPPELATLFNVGIWPLAAGTYDPALDGIGIPDGASVYGLFDSTYAALDAPSSITGYTSVDSVAKVAKGTYNVHNGSSGYNYVIIGIGDTTPSSAAPATPDDNATPTTTPAADSSLPPELATLFNVGKWPLAAGTYDPALDGIGIPNGASVYGLFDTTYAALPAPKSVTGYKSVDSVTKVVKGTYNVHNGSSGYNYVIIGIGDTTPSSAAPTPSPSPSPAADAGLPPELATLFNVGKWPLAAGTYDPALDGIGIPNGASVYGLFDSAYAAIPAPSSVTGYKSVDSVTKVVKGTYNVHNGSSGFNYVIVGIDDTTPSSAAPTPSPSPSPAADAGLPPELATLFNVGKWPLAAGTYDPALDGIGIPNGASVYGLFDSAYAAIPAPSSVTGYKSVDSVTKVVKGTYNVHNGSSGFNYVIVGIDDTTPSSPAPTPSPSPSPAADAGLPPELATLFNVGKWPLAAGTYDPALDGIGIPNGVSVYGLFDSAYAAIPAPASITGYSSVDSVTKVVKGTYNVHNGSSGFNYVIIGID